MARFFGYGSLVNARTHEFAQTRPVTLYGWRREWCTTRLRPVAYLSVRRCPKSTIDGLTATVPGGDWQALDRREAAYCRHPVTFAPGSGTAPAQIYQVDRQHLSPQIPPVLLLSYLDVVVQGYLRIFGPEGVTRFFDTTDGWTGTVLNDRAAPQYPRHQTLSPEETAMVDTCLAPLPVTMKQLE